MSATTQNIRQNIAPRYETGEDGRPIIPPPVTTDLHTRLANPNNYETDTGSLLSLHRTPDFRFPLLAWIHSISFSLQASAFATDPSASPASLTGYCLSLAYALLYFFDSAHQMTPSRTAMNVINGDQNFLNFLEHMLDLNVPSFMVPELLKWQTIFVNLASNLRLVTTLGLSPFLHDFGRQFPSSTFFALHNIQATLSARTDYSQLAAHFYSAVIATANIGTVNDVPVTPAMMFGTARRTTDNTTQLYRNWMSQAVDLLLAPNAIRSTFGTVTIRRLPLVYPALADLTSYNSYKYLTSWSTDNDLPLREIHASLSAWIKTTFPSSQPLRNFAQIGSSPAVSYLSFRTALPTWHTYKSPTQSEFPTDLVTPTSPVRTSTQFATDIRFCGQRNAVSNTTGGNVFLVAPGQDLDNAPAGSERIDFVDATQTTAPADQGDLNRRHFDSRTMVTPFARIINSDEVVPSSYGPILTSGFITETNSVSMIGIPTPNPNLPLHTQNTRFIHGAIRQESIRTAVTSDNQPFFIRRTNFSRSLQPSQLFVYGPTDRLRLPRFYQGNVEGTATATDNNSGFAQLAKFFPGTWINRNARRAMDVLNVFSFTLGNTARFIPDEEIVMWSSFRYYDNESGNTYWLPTLEHMSGLFYKEVTTVHPAVRISARF
jgi:hypothetical protein